jgi:hypothetical protein
MREALNSISYKVEFSETQPGDGLDAFNGTITRGKATLDFLVVVGEGADAYMDGQKQQLIRGVPNFTSVGFGSDGEVIVLDSLDRTGRQPAAVLDLSVALEDAIGKAVED